MISLFRFTTICRIHNPSTIASSSQVSASAVVMRPGVALYGHCRGYNIPEIIMKFSNESKIAKKQNTAEQFLRNFEVEVADSYTAKRSMNTLLFPQAALQQQQQVQNSSSSSLTSSSSILDKKPKSTKMFRGFELEDDEEEEGLKNKTNANITSQNQPPNETRMNNNNNESLSTSLQTFAKSANFAHVVLRIRPRSEAAEKIDGNREKSASTIGVFSNGAVVCFFGDAASNKSCHQEHRQERETSILKPFLELIKDCEKNLDKILFPSAGSTLNRQVDEILVQQEFSLTSISDLPSLGYSIPDWMNKNNNNDTHSDNKENKKLILPAADTCRKEDSIPSYIGYFDAGELNCIVLPSATSIEAQLPFLHALAESVEAEFLSIFVSRLANKTQGWRATLEKKSSSSSTSSATESSSSTSAKMKNFVRTFVSHQFIRSICPLRDVRVTYLQALRLSAKIARLKSRTEVFWTVKHAPQRVTYDCAYDHLEIEDRLEILENQVETVLETVSYLGGELRHDTEVVLEVAIILLIMMSLMLSIVIGAQKHRVSNH